MNLGEFGGVGHGRYDRCSETPRHYDYVHTMDTWRIPVVQIS